MRNRSLHNRRKASSFSNWMNHPKVLAVRKLPAWVLVAVLISAAAGAGSGTLLTGGITGNVPTVVEQGVVVEEPTVIAEGSGFANDQSFVSVNSDGTRFTVAVEMNVGDKFKAQIPVTNNSDSNLVAELSMEIPDGITVEVDQDGTDDSDATGIGNVIRTSLRTWKMDVTNASSTNDKLEVTVAHGDDAPPGFFSIVADLRQVDF